MTRIITSCCAVAAMLNMNSCMFIGIRTDKLAQGSISKTIQEALNEDIFDEDGNITIEEEDSLYYTDLSFSSICLYGGYEVEYSEGPSNVTVSAPKRLIGKVDVKSDSDVLEIRANDDNEKNWKHVKIVVTSPQLKALSVNGAVNFEAKEINSDDTFEMDIKGAGNIEIDSIKAQKIKIEAKGACNAELENVYCQELCLDMRGTSNVEISGEAKQCTIDIKGMGCVDISKFKCPDRKIDQRGLSTVLQ